MTKYNPTYKLGNISLQKYIELTDDNKEETQKEINKRIKNEILNLIN